MHFLPKLHYNLEDKYSTFHSLHLLFIFITSHFADCMLHQSQSNTFLNTFCQQVD